MELRAAGHSSQLGGGGQRDAQAAAAGASIIEVQRAGCMVRHSGSNRVQLAKWLEGAPVRCRASSLCAALDGAAVW
jgi:hypothetical protein